ncbi:hypothetical protein OQA88_3587 [Cercophora sp. LCS_1]
MSVAADLITLDNFEEKMPRWEPGNSSHLYALVDMGSNGIRFSISDLSPPRTRLFKCLYRERAAISLFDALNKPKRDQGTPALTFPADTIALVAQTLARFWSIAVTDYRVPPNQVTVFATEAMRRAQNAASMLEAIRAQAPDLVVYVLAPQVETLFGSVGARSGFVDVKGLFLDLGGGSVQMTYMDSHAARANTESIAGNGYEVAAALTGQSMPFGAARLINILEDADAEVQETELSKLKTQMKESFENLRAAFPSLAETVAAAHKAEGKDEKKASGIDIYLCGGGFRGYGSILMHTDSIQPYPIPAVGSFTVSGKAFCKTKEMIKVNKEYEGRIFGMSKRRRAQFPAIVAVVEALIAAVPRIRSVTFCAGGNREGALMMKLPRDLRESNPLICLEAPGVPGGAVGVQFILDTLRSALPRDGYGGDDVFGLKLGTLYTHKIWENMGEDPEANASGALHDAVARDPGCPGLTHLARAVLGLTVCARWGANLGPIDQHLYKGLRDLIDTADPDASFWADYIGAVTAALTTLVLSWPRSEAQITDNVKFKCKAEQGGKKFKVHLDISVSRAIARGISLQNLVDIFDRVDKKRDDKKVVVTTSMLD